MIKGVIFDLDGVLVSTDQLHFKAWQRLAEELGIMNFTKKDNEKQKGISRMESLEVVLQKGNRVYSEEEKITLTERKNNYYIELLQDLDTQAVLPDVIETLTMLRKMGIAIGVGSVSKNAPKILEKTKLEQYIDQVSSGLDITKSKPDPEVFLVAAKKLNLQTNECLVVEDSAAGIIAARAACMKSLAVGPEHKILGADYESLTLLSNVDWKKILFQED